MPLSDTLRERRKQRLAIRRIRAAKMTSEKRIESAVLPAIRRLTSGRSWLAMFPSLVA